MSRKDLENAPEAIEEEPQKSGSSFWDYLRFGESYTSLILGIVVVIVATALLLSYVHNKNAGSVNVPVPQETQTNLQISQKASEISSRPHTEANKVVEVTAIPTTVPTKIAKVNPTTVPTKAQPTSKPMVDNKAAKTKNTTPTMPKENVYTVKHGDTLWSISEKQYKNGYNWVDIARVNKLSNPEAIYAGNKLIMPKIAAKIATTPVPTIAPKANVQKNTTSQGGSQMGKVTGDTYTVVKNDTLWNIAVRSYGDGYRWVDIARANNLTNPSIIHSGNKLKIPRNK